VSVLNDISSCFKENTGKFSIHAGALVSNHKWLPTVRSNEAFRSEAQRIKWSNGERHDASAAGPIWGKGRNPEHKGIVSITVTAAERNQAAAVVLLARENKGRHFLPCFPFPQRRQAMGMVRVASSNTRAVY
jgi:hypothetical protein